MASESMEREIGVLRNRLRSEDQPDGRAFAPLADALRRAGRLDEALALLDEGLKRYPDYATGFVVAGLVYRDAGEEEAAEEALSRVLGLDAENVVALDGLAEIAQARDDREGALTYLRDLRELDPSHPTVTDRIRALEEEPAVEPQPEIEAGLEPETEPESPPEVSLEPEPKARPEAGRVPEEEGEVYTRTMAELYHRQGLTERAVRVYERLVEEAPDDPDLRARLDELRGEANPSEATTPPEEVAPEAEAGPDARQKPEGELTAEGEGEGLPWDGPALEPVGLETDSDYPASEATLTEADFTLDDLVPREEAASDPPLEGLQEGRGGPSPEGDGPEGHEADDPGDWAPQWSEPREEPVASPSDAPSPWGAVPGDEEEDEALPRADVGLPVSRYFEAVLSWVPGAVPIESLAPETVSGPSPEEPPSAGEAPRAEEPSSGRDEDEDRDDDEEEFQAWLGSLEP